MHFTSSVHNTAFVKVLGYVELCSGSGDTSFQKRSYADLCKVFIHQVANLDSFAPSSFESFDAA